MYRINKNIYFIKGAYNACIYNLNTCELIPIMHNDINQVQLCFLGNYDNDDVVDMLVKHKVLVRENEYNCTDIIICKDKDISIAWVEITSQCNLRCVHCYVNGNRISANFMTFDDFKIAIDRVIEYGIRRIHIIGGEPLVHRDFHKMMKYVADKDLYVVLFSNGLLINDDEIKFLKECNISQIDISLYSTIREQHELVTMRKGSFDDTLRTIKRVEESGIVCHIATIKMPGVDIGEVYNSDSDNKAVQHFDYVRSSGRGYDYIKNHREYFKGKSITSDINKRKLDPQKVLFKMSRHNCFGRYIRIDSNLDVYPCTMEQRIKHGNIRHSYLKEVLNLEICKMNKDHIKECCVCEYRYICSDCRPDNMGNEITDKPWFCTYNPLNGVWKTI